MIEIRKSTDRGRTRVDWLDSRHSFSFGHYADRRHMGFRTLRVVNEDWIEPDSGFGWHPHRDMEIFTFVVEGALEHQDSTGARSVLRPGRVQLMTAGQGILHSELNPSPDEPTHLLQVWLLPDREGREPSYAELDLAADPRPGLETLATAEGRGGGLVLHQDASIHLARVEPDALVALDLASGRHAWVQVVSGAGSVAGRAVEAGDGVAISDEARVVLEGAASATMLVFDLA